jgi:hypothetical protein
MTSDKSELDRRKNRRIWWAFFVSLIAMNPINNYLSTPFAEHVLNAPESLFASVLGGAMTGAFFCALIWFVVTRGAKSRETST